MMPKYRDSKDRGPGRPAVARLEDTPAALRADPAGSRTSPRILIVDDEPAVRETFARFLKRSDYAVESVESAEKALSRLGEFRPDLVITDVRMEGMDGLSLVRRVRSTRPDIDLIVITGCEDMRTAVDAIRAGAYDYLAKPIEFERLGAAITRCLRDRDERRRLHRPDRAEEVASPERDRLVGRDSRMVEIYKMIGALAGSRAPVLIRGETGTGKELVARAIHDNSPDAAEPFLAVNCTALSETLLETELFGHVRGAFTGAVQQRRGFFELAGSGTIFLDEIGDTSPALQAKLLRVLQEREFFPVGGEHPRRTEARVIAATNRPLEELVASGRLREDLYFRLRVVEIALPPLRERRGDIPLLARHLLARAARAARKDVRSIPDDVMDALVACDWPGNIRELENVLTRSVVLARGASISLAHLGLETLSAVAPAPGPPPASDALEDAIVAHVRAVLARTRGNKRKAARLLGISRSRLDRILQREDDVASK